jgi:thiol-disulfide isomerase/thioredoxin
MKGISRLLMLIVWCAACTDDREEPSPAPPGVNALSISASSNRLPFHPYAVSVLTCKTNRGDNVTKTATFYANGVELSDNRFIPAAIGNTSVHCTCYNLESDPVEIVTEEARSRKVLIEFFTSRTCGFCPWIAQRLDSLNHANDKVISYSIHGEDELEVNETAEFQAYQHVYDRPSVRIDRGYVRNYAAPIEIKKLIDSVYRFLSIQPKVEIALQTRLIQDQLTIDVSCKYHERVWDSLYLTLALVEDSITTYDQYNYFSGYLSGLGPFASQPPLLPEFNNHNVLRRFLTGTRGELVTQVPYVKGVEQHVKSVTVQLDPAYDKSNMRVIAIFHRRRDDVEVSSVHNAQIVRVGERVDFNE